MAEDLPPGDPFVTDDEIGEKIDGTEWTQCTQQSTGRLYFYNFATEESSWTLPQEDTEAEADGELTKLSVECPDGCGPGDLLSVDVDGTLVEVEVPDGIGPGDAFEVLLQPSEADRSDPGSEVDAFDDEPAVTRRFKLLVMANAHVSEQKAVRVEASTIDELSERLGEAVGVVDAVVCSPSDAALDETMYTSLDEVDEKQRVMVWPAMAFEEEVADEVAEPAVQRDFILMVQANEHVQTNKKLKLTADTLEELCSLIREALHLRSELTMTCPTAAPQEGDCFSSLSEVESKAKVMVWPAATLRHLFAVATVEQRREAEAAEAARVQAQADAARAAEEEASKSVPELSDEPPGDPFAADDEIGGQIDGTEWAECIQTSTGRVYYFNFDTEESSWDVPELDNEGDQVLEKQSGVEALQLEPEPEEILDNAEEVEEEEEEEEEEEVEERGKDQDADEEQQQEEEEEEEEEEHRRHQQGTGDDHNDDDDEYNDQPGPEAMEALARYSREPPVGTSSRRDRRSNEDTSRSRRQRGRRSYGAGGGSGGGVNSSRRRRSRSNRQDKHRGKRSPKPSTPKSSPRSPAIIVRGPDFDSSCHPSSRPPEYDPSRDKYMPPEYRKRIAEKRREIERAKALEHEMTVRQRYERWSSLGYDEDEYSDDDDYSHSEYSSDYSSGQDEDDEQEHDQESLRGDSAPEVRTSGGRGSLPRPSETEQLRSPRGKPIPGSIALQHRVTVRPSDCDMFGELSAGSGVQFCADAMDVWTLRSTKKPSGAVPRSEQTWRAVVNRSDTQWVRRVQSGDEIVMTVEVCRWRRDGGFDVSFEARVDGEDVFRTDCRFHGLNPSPDGWVSAPPTEAFKRLWSE